MAYGTVSLDSITSSGNLSVVGNVLISGGITGNLNIGSGNINLSGSINIINQTAVVPHEQIYRLHANVIGQNATGAQNIFGVGVTLNSNTVYQFQTAYTLFKLTGTATRTISLLFGGTATINNIGYMLQSSLKANHVTITAPDNMSFFTTQSAVTVTASSVVAIESFVAVVNGTVSINQGGTFIPQYSLSGAPGAGYNTLFGSYFKISAIGPANGFNSNVGYWA